MFWLILFCIAVIAVLAVSTRKKGRSQENVMADLADGDNEDS
jgi:cbb3-type cytochrome oxidase subunit 3